MPNAFMPPNGFAGLAQQTPAVQSLYSGGARPRAGGSRKRKVKVRGRARTRSARLTRRIIRAGRHPSLRKPAHMVKGSAAAKRHMAKLRRMRRR